MEQSQQLQQLIERALENGWSFHGRDDVDAQNIVFWIEGYETDGEGYSVNDILFGDNLSFLEALVGDKPTYHAVRTLVITPDSKRIPWLYKRVFP